MIVGLINLQGPLELQKLVQSCLTESGLLEATDVVYFSRSAIIHPNAIRVQEDIDMYMKAKQSANSLIWSISTEEFVSGRVQTIDWLKYELYFIVEQWRLAVEKLQNGYEAYGVNLHFSPEPHFEAYCFWMRSDAMNRERLQRPYCVFQSFKNHYLDIFPRDQYEDFDPEQSAPFSNRRHLERLSSLSELEPETASFGMLVLLLLYSKMYFDALPTVHSERPYVINDVADHASLAFAVPGFGRMDTLANGEITRRVRESWRELGWVHNFNIVEQLGLAKADIIYTTLDRITGWLPKLSANGIFIVKGVYYGNLATQQIGSYSIVALKESAFQTL